MESRFDRANEANHRPSWLSAPHFFPYQWLSSHDCTGNGKKRPDCLQNGASTRCPCMWSVGPLMGLADHLSHPSRLPRRDDRTEPHKPIPNSLLVSLRQAHGGRVTLPKMDRSQKYRCASRSGRACPRHGGGQRLPLFLCCRMLNGTYPIVDILSRKTTKCPAWALSDPAFCVQCPTNGLCR